MPCRAFFLKIFHVACLFALLPLGGCFFEPIIKNPRSLGPGQKSLTIAAEYMNVSGSQNLKEPSPLPTPTYYSSWDAPSTLSGSSHYWSSGAAFSIGTWYPGLEVGVELSMAAALMGNLKYQFLGYETNPNGVAGAAGLEFGALLGNTLSNSSTGYTVAGFLAFGSRFGPADLYVGGRLGIVDSGQTTNNNYYNSYSYSNTQYWTYDDPSSYSYYDLYAGAEADILPRLSLVAGFSMRNLINQPYASTPYDAYSYSAPAGSYYETTFDPIYMFSLGIKLHSRTQPLSPEEKLEERAKLDRIQERRNRKRKKLDRLDEMENSALENTNSSSKTAEGTRLLHVGEYLLALEKFNEVEDVNFPNFELEMSMGYCHYMLKHWHASLAHYQKALELAPENTKLRSTVETLKQKIQSEPAGDEKNEDLLPK